MQEKKCSLSLKAVIHKSFLHSRTHFLKQLPYSLVIGFIYFLALLDFSTQELSESVKIFLVGLWVFIPSLVCAMAILAHPKNHKFLKPFIEIPALFGVFISVSLIPVIISFACIIVFWFIENWLNQFGLVNFWFGLTTLLVCLPVTSKILAPLFLLLDDEELNMAIDKSEKAINTPTVIAKIYTLLIMCIASYASLSWLEGHGAIAIKVGITVIFNIIWVNIWVAIKDQLS